MSYNNKLHIKLQNSLFLHCFECKLYIIFQPVKFILKVGRIKKVLEPSEGAPLPDYQRHRIKKLRYFLLFLDNLMMLS
jgi:hypothetical protein